jgi:hypothetical protein
MEKPLKRNYFFPSIRHISMKRQKIPREPKQFNPNTHQARIVELLPTNLDIIRRTPSPLPTLSSVKAVNSVIQSPLERYCLSPTRSKEKSGNIISFYTRSSKRNVSPPKLICTYKNVQSKTSTASVTKTPSPRYDRNDFSCQIDM